MKKCQICSKQFSSTPKTCTYCPTFLCSSSCLHNHITVFHSEEHHLPSKSLSSLSSPFLTVGSFNTDPSFSPPPPSLPLKFEHIKSSNNKNIILGSGTFGQVYLMKNLHDNKFYAIKHMKKENLINHLGTLSVVYREINLHSRITHDNIIKLHSYIETKTAFDLIMEYANSGSLFTYIKHNKGFNEDTAFEFFIQVCNAIHFLHKYGLIHRDLKPENILLIDNKKVKLCDFGWCVEKGERSRSTYCGTFEYMAPEMVGRVQYGKSIDIWSLGILLYELIHGYSPFRAVKEKNNSNEIMTNILRHNLVFHKEISMECKKLIEDLLREDPEERITIEDVFMSDFVKKYMSNGINNMKISLEEKGLVNTIRMNKEVNDDEENGDIDECDEGEKKDVSGKVAPGAIRRNPFEEDGKVGKKAGHFVDTIREFPLKKGKHKSEQVTPVKKESKAEMILKCKVCNFLQAKQWLTEIKPGKYNMKKRKEMKGLKMRNKSLSKAHRNYIDSRTCSVISGNTDTQATSFSNMSNNIKQSKSFANMLVGIKIK